MISLRKSHREVTNNSNRPFIRMIPQITTQQMAPKALEDNLTLNIFRKFMTAKMKRRSSPKRRRISVQRSVEIVKIFLIATQFSCPFHCFFSITLVYLIVTYILRTISIFPQFFPHPHLSRRAIFTSQFNPRIFHLKLKLSEINFNPDCTTTFYHVLGFELTSTLRKLLNWSTLMTFYRFFIQF